jgi:nitroreductase
VEQEKLERILRAGFEAPSAGNRRPWEFIVLTREEDRAAVAALSPYAKMAAQAPALIVPCGSFAPDKVPGPEDIWWVQDLSAATENVLLQITGEGLGGVWLGWYPDHERVEEFSRRFGLPPQVIPFSVIALGYPAAPVSSADRYDPAKVHYGRYTGEGGRRAIRD